MFGRLDSSWRPFREEDREASKQMMDYLANFARNGEPNGPALPVWQKTDRHNAKVLCIRLKDTRMGRPSYFRMTKNMLTKGEPKA